MRFPASFLDDLRARLPVSEVVGRRVSLKKAGREWKGLSPFNKEKTPSFFVNDQKAAWFDFSSGKNGNIFDFVMQTEGVNFPEAVERLASMAGVPLPRVTPEAEAREERRKTLHDIVELAAKFFEATLQSRNGAKARGYLADRAIEPKTQLRFRIGYAPSERFALKEHLGSQGISAEDMIEAGLLVHGDDIPVPYDRFRDRVMFPIRDSRGRIVGFGGRVIDAGEPKYLNSPETSLFHKGRELYGLFEARQQLRTIGQLLVVEGYMDVVRLAQAGIHYAVATLGTATTPEHLNRMFRVCNDVIFCFDGDRAGRQAAWRALETCLPQAREGRQLKFLFLPEGHDPDTLVAEEGKAAFEARMDHALPLSEYLVGHLAAETDLATVDGRARLAELARPLLARIPEGVYRELLVDRLATEIRMPAGRLAKLLGLAAGVGEPAPGTRASPTARSPQTPTTSGRGSLVSQAIARLVQYPEAARQLGPTEGLRAAGDRALAVLAELVEMACAGPNLSSAQLVERWRDRPEHARLEAGRHERRRCNLLRDEVADGIADFELLGAEVKTVHSTSPK